MSRALALVALLASSARADDATYVAKKDAARAAKSMNQRRLPAVGTKPDRLVNLYNSWTHEWVAVGEKEKLPPSVIDRFLRDHYTNELRVMEPKLIDFIRSATIHFGKDTAIVVSAFRHPKYNLIKRKKGHQVARDSQHTHGTAVDFYVPGVNVMPLHAWAKAQALGGLGLYLDSGFIHMDTGKVRYWGGE